jgi:Na+-transporting methylmalonyl-CoA/oxaloacetate decarboxylase gamma subunit
VAGERFFRRKDRLKGGIYMSILESFLVSVLCMSIVFVLLGAFYFLMNLLSGVVKYIEKPKQTN